MFTFEFKTMGPRMFTMLKCDCDKKYSLIGKGYARYVYDLGDGNVLKIAKHGRGAWQNESEIRLFEKLGDCGVLLPIEYKDESSHSLWVVQKKVQPMNYDNEYLFQECYNITFKDVINSIEKIENFKNRKKSFVYSDNEFLNKLEHFLVDGEFCAFFDLKYLSNWGYLNGNIYIIDYGLDSISYKKHCGKFHGLF